MMRKIHIRADGTFASMNAEDFLAAFDVCGSDLDLTVKAARRSSSGIQKRQTLGGLGGGGDGRNDDNAFIGLKPSISSPATGSCVLLAFSSLPPP